MKADNCRSHATLSTPQHKQKQTANADPCCHLSHSLTGQGVSRLGSRLPSHLGAVSILRHTPELLAHHVLVLFPVIRVQLAMVSRPAATALVPMPAPPTTRSLQPTLAAVSGPNRPVVPSAVPPLPPSASKVHRGHVLPPRCQGVFAHRRGALRPQRRVKRRGRRPMPFGAASVQAEACRLRPGRSFAAARLAKPAPGCAAQSAGTR
jgi:hypothetical protein